MVSVAKLVKDAVALGRAGAQTSIVASISEDLWFAEVDPGQIGQVLHKILLNARQSIPEGGIIEVQAENVVLKNAPGTVRISVRDYGCGIREQTFITVTVEEIRVKLLFPILGLDVDNDGAFIN